MADTMNGGHVRAYLLEGLARTAGWHETEAKYAGITKQIQHEEAAQSLRYLHGVVEALPIDHPKLEELAAICVRTECRCCRGDEDFFRGIEFRAVYQTLEQLLDALLVQYRKIDRAEATSAIG